MSGSSRSSRRSTAPRSARISSSSSIFASRSGSTEPSGWGTDVGLEGAHHVHERVHAAQRGQVHERRALALGHARHVHVLDGGGVFFFGL